MTALGNYPDLGLFEKQAENFSLIPLIGKRPFEENWQKSCQTKRDFREEDFTDHNAGVCCGPASNLLVLDIDDPPAFNSLLEANGLSIPDTYTVTTGSDKSHYYFQYPQDGKEHGNKSLKHPVYSKHTVFDIRGQGGQVVAAGSIHPDTGKPYRIKNDAAVAPPPEWLLKYLNGDGLNTDALWNIPLPEPKRSEFIESLSIGEETRRIILEGESKGKRSEAQMKVINALVGGNYSERVIFYIFDHYPVGEKFKEKGSNRDTWLKAEIERAKQYVSENSSGANNVLKASPPSDLEDSPDQLYADEIQELNQKHAAVMLGGKCVIMNEDIDPVFNRNDITFSSIHDLRNFYSNRRVPNPRGSGLKPISIADIWMDSPRRRQYDGIIFSPGKNFDGYYNLFRGFAVEPRKGDWSLFKNHIREVIAGGNEEAYRYIIAWMAHLVQEPGGERPGTAVVLRGKQGTGKGCFASQFGKIFGNHFIQITNQNQLTGRFNNHLKDALLVFVDEGIWAGDRAAEGVLKGMITEEQIMVEPKGKDAFAVKNHLRLIVASNNNWVVPAGLEERRFFVLDVSDKHMQNQEYFKPIFEQMDNGGREAMLYDLMEYDLTGIDLRCYPRTEALMDQITSSMTPVKKFWYERLKEGSLSSSSGKWEDKILSKSFYDEFVEFSDAIGMRHKMTNSVFGKELKNMCPGIERKKLQAEYGNARNYYLCFPSLDKCREDFETMVNMEIDWGEQVP